MLSYAKPPSVDSDCYISAGAYEVIEYLYFAWGIYKEHENEKREFEPTYGQYVSKMERPCVGCHSYKLCAEDGMECRHFRQWKDTGKWDPSSCSWK